MTKRSEQVKARREAYRAQGLCPDCREHRPLAEGRKYCRECLEYRAMKHREYYEPHPRHTGSSAEAEAFSSPEDRFEKFCRQPGTRINDIFTMIEKGKGWRAIRNRYPEFTKIDFRVYEKVLRGRLSAGTRQGEE